MGGISRRTAVTLFGTAVLPALTGNGATRTQYTNSRSTHQPTTYLENAPNPLISVRDIRWALMRSSLRGWGQAEHQQVVEELLRLDPDLIHEGLQGCHRGPPADAHFWREYEITREFALGHGIPFDVGVSYRIKPTTLYEHWYRDLPNEERWRYPDGSLVEHPREIGKRNFDGSIPRYGSDLEGVNDSITPSLFAEATGDHLIACVQDIYEFGANYSWVDLFIDALLGGLDFSVWAQAAFREHLQQLSNDDLAALGIADPALFDFKTYLQEQGIAPPDTDTPPFLDPVFREYQLLHHRQQKQLVERIATETRAGLPNELRQAGTSFHGEGHWLQWQALNVANIYMADHLDVVHLGLGHPTIPPHRPHDVSVKLCRAVGRFDKPVFVDGSEWSVQGELFGVDPTEYHPTLIQFALAQAYCHGGTRRLPITTLGNNTYESTIKAAMRPDGTVGDSIHEFVDFIQAHRRFLRDFTEANDTVVMVSLPTLVYRAPQWGWYGTGHAMPLGEAATVLRREHIPYDVQIFDYPPLWEAPDQTKNLTEYNRIILPGITCVSDRHVAGIKAALEAGATVIATAGAPTRDEDYQPRDDLRQLLTEADNGVILDYIPERGPNQTVKEGPGMGALADVLAETPQRVVLDTAADISVNVFRQSDPDRVIVHLLNFEYDPETKSVPQREDLTVTIRDLGVTPGVARYYSPAGPTPVAVTTTEQGVQVTVPQLDVWGFVVLGESEAAVTAPVRREVAAEEIAAVQEELDRLFAIVSKSSEHYHALERASYKVENAEHAFDYAAYEVATDLAAEARALLPTVDTSTTTTTPTTTAETATITSTAETTTSAQTTTSGNTGPGFGVIAGIVGVAAGVAALVRSSGSDDE